MKQRRKPRMPVNSFSLWTGLARKTAEMMIASSQVISHRTGRMAAAGPTMSRRDQQEFTLMSREKIEAATESAQAIATRMVRLNQEIGALAWKQMRDSTTTGLLLANSRTVAQSGKLQAKLVRDALTNSAVAVSRLSDSVARVAHTGLKPIHVRATANARRLGKRRHK
jgi:hypothetical protein